MVIQSHKLVSKAWGLLILIAVAIVLFALFNEQYHYTSREEFFALLWPVGWIFICLVIITGSIHAVVQLRHRQNISATFSQLGINFTKADGSSHLLAWKELHKIEASIKPDTLFYAPQVWHFFSTQGTVDVPNITENNHQQLDLMKVLQNMRNVNWDEYQAFQQDSQRLFITDEHRYQIWQQGGAQRWMNV